MYRYSKLNIVSVILLCMFSIYYCIPTLLPGISKQFNFFIKDEINLGLDLKGGVSLLLGVDTNQYIDEQLNNELDDIRLRSKKDHNIDIYNAKVLGNKIIIHDNNAANLRLKLNIGLEFRQENNDIIIQFTTAKCQEIENNLINQAVEIIRKRVDESGTREVDLQRQGEASILLQIPGISDPKQLKRIIGKTAKLSFHLVDSNANIKQMLNGKIIPGVEILPIIHSSNQFIAVKSRPALTGEMLTNAQSTVHNSAPVVNFQLNNIGSQIFADLSTTNTGSLLAIVLDDKVISAPRLKEPILGGSGVISGNFSVESAGELALLLRAGALPASINIMEERFVGPILGQDSIESGTKAVIIGGVLVVLTMVLFYGIFGIIANIALVMNFFFLLSLLILLDATLTLPGIAGIVLTLGMAVDANVLIYERIREEFNKGRTVISAIKSGYKFAFVTIMDSNITTIIAAIVLYIFGNGPVRGFAVTLSLGIICSLFTSIVLTKILISYWYKKKQFTTLPI